MSSPASSVLQPPLPDPKYVCVKTGANIETQEERACVPARGMELHSL